MEIIIKPEATLSSLGIEEEPLAIDLLLHGLGSRATYENKSYLLKSYIQQQDTPLELSRHAAKIGELINNLPDADAKAFFIETKMYMEIDNGKAMLMFDAGATSVTLQQWVQEIAATEGGQFTARMIRAMIFQLVFALAHANTHWGFQHNDLNMRNIFIDRYIEDDEEFTVDVGGDTFSIDMPKGTPLLKIGGFEYAYVGGTDRAKRVTNGLDQERSLYPLPPDVLLGSKLQKNLVNRQNDTDMIAVFEIMANLAAINQDVKGDFNWSFEKGVLSSYITTYKDIESVQEYLPDDFNSSDVQNKWDVMYIAAMHLELETPESNDVFLKLEERIDDIGNPYQGIGGVFREKLGSYATMFMRNLIAYFPQDREAFGVLGMGKNGSFYTFANALYHPYFAYKALESLNPEPGPEMKNIEAPLIQQQATRSRAVREDDLSSLIADWEKELEGQIVQEEEEEQEEVMVVTRTDIFPTPVQEQLEDKIDQYVDKLYSMTAKIFDEQGKLRVKTLLSRRQEDDIPSFYDYLHLYVQFANDFTDPLVAKNAAWVEKINTVILPKTWGTTGLFTQNNVPIPKYTYKVDVEGKIKIRNPKRKPKPLNFVDNKKVWQRGYDVIGLVDKKNRKEVKVSVLDVIRSMVVEITLMLFVKAVVRGDSLGQFEMILEPKMKDLVRISRQASTREPVLIAGAYQRFLQKVPGLQKKRFLK